MSPSIDETRDGSYKIPFSLSQYGAFVKRYGRWSLVAAGFSPDDAREKAVDYYNEMNKYPHNDMDMDTLDDIQIRRRFVTYGCWEEQS